VARLFASSPPASTFIEEDDLREESEQPIFPARHTSADKVGAGDGPEKPDDKKAAPAQLSFEAVQVQPAAPPRQAKSGLSAVLSSDPGTTLLLRATAGPKIGLTLFLPDRRKAFLRVPADATVLQAIALAIANDRTVDEQAGDVRLFGEPAKYELRIHDEDGLPDFDYPALDGQMKLENFVDASDGEFCLLPVAGLEDPEPVAGETKPAEAPMTRTELAEKAYAEKRGKGIVLIKIYLPENGTYITVNISQGMPAMKLLSVIQTKQRLPLFTEDYQFFLPEEERERLGRESAIVPMKEILYESGIRNLELRRRKYADAPMEGKGGGQDLADPFRERGNSAAIHDEDHVTINRRPPKMRFNPDNFLFNDQTAALYKQWNVIKTNKWGKRQRRIFGIDYQKIYNKKQEKDSGKSMLPNQSVKRAERLIADVLRFEIDADDPSTFSIWWKDLGSNSNPEGIKLEYEVQSGPEAAAEIVAKMKYIISKRDK